MTKNALPLFLGLLLLSGCAHQYVIRLTNGTELTSPKKPKLRGANYYVKDAKGEEHAIPQSRVAVIEPTSMYQEEKTAEAKKAASYPEPKRHWWQFWR